MYKREKNCDRRHSFANHFFFGLSLTVISFMLMFAGAASATVTYDGTKILISDGAESLTSINQTLNNISLIQEVSSKVWLLKKPLQVESTGSLYINNGDCNELRLLSLNTPSIVYIKDYGYLEIDSTSIKSWNTTTNAPAPNTDSYRSYIQALGSDSEVKATNSSITYLGRSGQRGFDMTHTGISLYVDNCDFYDSTYGIQVESEFSPTVEVYNSWNMKYFRSTNDNVMIRNCSMVGGTTLEYADNVTIDAITCHQATWNGITMGNTKNSIIKNSVVTSVNAAVPHNAIEVGVAAAGEGKSINNTVKNCTVHDYSPGNNPYYISKMTNDEGYWVENVVIEDCTAYNVPNSGGIVTDASANMTVRRFKSWNINQDISLSRSKDTWIIDSELDPVDGYIMTTNTPNTNAINTKPVGTQYGFAYSDLTAWYYLDVQVVDQLGNPVSGANVTVTHPDVTVATYGWIVSPKAINLHVIPRVETDGLLDPQPIITSYTKADGHTPLPADNSDYTIVIAERRWDQQHHWSDPRITTHFNNWTITAEKNGVSATVTGIDPDANWYRSNPNTYQNTITIVLDTGAPDTTPPTASNGSPTGTISDNTPSLSVISNESATCKGTIDLDETYDNMDFTFTGTDTSYSYDVSSPLSNGTHTVYVRCRDTAGNTATTSYSWSFTIQTDTTPPTITASSPTGTSVTVNTTITVTFSEAMNQSSAQTSFSVSPSVTGSFTWNTNQMIFTPSSNLAYNTAYTVTISTGAKDLAGNALSSPYSWSFTTQTQPTGDLVGYWKFDEGSETTATDSSGKGNNGTINGATWVDGKIGKALSFDGTNDYVNCGNNASLSPLKVTQEAWVNVREFHATTNNRYEVVTRDDMIRIVITTNTYKPSFGGKFSGVWNSVTGNTTIQTGIWYHIVGTFDGSKLRIYVNGVEDATPVNETGSISYTTTSCFIGRHGTDSVNYFSGLIDEVRIYNRALTASEVLAHYQEGITGAISGTVKDTFNNPIQNATVSDGTRSATTAADGAYTITSVPVGTYTVTTSKTGYQSSSQSGVVVNEGATTTVNLVLTATVPTLTGDLNVDGKVNSLDYSLLVGKWFQTTGITSEDLNKDGIINIRDLGIMMSNWKE